MAAVTKSVARTSVSARRANLKNMKLENSAAAAKNPAPGPTNRRPSAYVTATVSQPAIAKGSRPPNSFTPKILNDTAAAQYASGGL